MHIGTQERRASATPGASCSDPALLPVVNALGVPEPPGCADEITVGVSITRSIPATLQRQQTPSDSTGYLGICRPRGNKNQSVVPLWALAMARSCGDLRATTRVQNVGYLSLTRRLVSHAPMARGVIPSLLGAVWLLAFVGLRYPLQMLPLLIFEFVRKTNWLIAFGLPQWSSGQLPPTFAEDFQAIGMGVILMPLVIPWGYVYRHYVKQRADRWR